MDGRECEGEREGKMVKIPLETNMQEKKRSIRKVCSKNTGTLIENKEQKHRILLLSDIYYICR